MRLSSLYNEETFKAITNSFVLQKNQKLKHDFVQHSANLDDFKCVINGNVRLDELKLRLMREYPAFLYNGKLLKPENFKP